MHHLYPGCNFSLNFRVWDYLFRSYKPIEYWIGLRAKGKEAASD